MKKLSVAICTTALFVAFPVLAQSNAEHGEHGEHGHGHGNHGNNSNHSGHDDDGNSAGHRKDRPHGFGDHDDNLVLSTPTNVVAVGNAMTSATAALRSGSLVSAGGTIVPQQAQTRTYAALSADPAQSASAAEMLAALSTAGPQTKDLASALVRGFSRLSSDPAQLPSVIATYNDFTKAASDSFIANPPPEFIALHAVLKQLVTASNPVM